jgi:hypothetical protein
MAFRPDKYNVLSATRKKNPIKFNNTLHGHPLGSMEQAIYLGLTIGLYVLYTIAGKQVDILTI